MVAFLSLLRAIEYIERRIAHAFSPEDVAKAAYLSTSQLNRLFARVFHCSPANYILKRRLCVAAKALATTDLSITDIALDAQFSAPESFTRAFKRQFLQTPSQYRRTRKRFYDLYPPMLLPDIREGRIIMASDIRKYDISEVCAHILACRGTYLMLVDMDRLMDINEKLGTQAGDAALAALALRIERSLSENMRFYRTGNDDFTVLTGVDNHALCDQIADRITQGADEEVPYPGGTLRVTAGIGIARIPDDAEDARAVLSAAGSAVASAKRRGQGRYAFYHDDEDARAHILAAKNTYILLADMDGVKEINDTLGHAAGDAAIAAVEDRIRRSIEPSMRFFRTGGDEFTILSGCADAAACEAVAQRILSHSGEAVAYPGGTLNTTVSLGIALISPDLKDAKVAVAHADEALLRAKRAGPGAYRIYAEI